MAPSDAGRTKPSPFSWEASAPTRIISSAALSSASIGLLLALFQVQGWMMPKLLAIPLIVVLIGMIVAALAVIVYEGVGAFRRFLENRATSAAWVSSEKPGLLDYEADGIRATNRFTKELDNLNEDTEALGKKLNKHSKRMDRAANKSGRKKQRLANRTAKDIDKSAVFVEKRLTLLEAIVKDIRRNTEGIITSVELRTAEDLAMAKVFAATLKEGRETTLTTIDSVADYCETVRDLEQQNVSRTVRIACQRQGAALDGVVKMLRRHETALQTNGRALDRKIVEAEGRGVTS